MIQLKVCKRAIRSTLARRITIDTRMLLVLKAFIFLACWLYHTLTEICKWFYYDRKAFQLEPYRMHNIGCRHVKRNALSKIAAAAETKKAGFLWTSCYRVYRGMWERIKEVGRCESGSRKMLLIKSIFATLLVYNRLWKCSFMRENQNKLDSFHWSLNFQFCLKNFKTFSVIRSW